MEEDPSVRFFDMHCHIDFQQDPACFLEEARLQHLAFLSCTVTPEGYLAARSWSGSANVALGIGAHPWWVARGEISPESFEILHEEIASVPFIGEIGCDLSPKHADPATRDLQAGVFRSICRKAAQAGGKVLSIHSVKSAGLVLDILDEAGCTDPVSGCTPILHWFSGSVPELWRAIHAGCFFSIGVPFLKTRRAKEYLKLMPKDRLLLETDYPPEHAGFCAEDYSEALSEAAALIAQAWQVPEGEAEAILAATSASVFSQARG